MNMKNIVNKLCAVALGAAGLSTGVLSVAKADTTAFTPTLSLNGSGTGNDGLFFTPTTAISVTSLGYVDCGFSVGHDVGLYDVTTSTLLASTTVTISSTPLKGFYYNLIAPVLLTPDEEYAIVGTQVPADSNWTADSLTAAPDLIYDGYKYDYNSSLDLPSIPYATAYFGPNFQYAVESVPEPATGSCFLLGLVGLVYLCRLKTGRPIQSFMTRIHGAFCKDWPGANTGFVFQQESDVRAGDERQRAPRLIGRGGNIHAPGHA
jgi:hypothetical protein